MPDEQSQEKEQEFVYLKNNKHAESFTDHANQLNIAGKEVKKVPKEILMTKSIVKHLANKHIVEATEEEFNKWNDYVKKNQENPNDDYGMSTGLQNAQAAVGQATGDASLATATRANASAGPIKDGDDDDEDTLEEMSKSELIDLAKANPKMTEEEKALLTKMNKADLIALNRKYGAE